MLVVNKIVRVGYNVNVATCQSVYITVSTTNKIKKKTKRRRRKKGTY